MITFEDYINHRVEKFGEKEKLSFRKIEDNLFESDRYLSINRTIDLSNVGFIFVCSNNNKFYYRNI